MSTTYNVGNLQLASSIQDNTDPTKKVNLSLANISTGTTYTATFPAANFTFAGLDTVQTFTNKTIDASLNTILNITDSSIKSTATINASKIANGTVSNTQFQYLNSLGSAAIGINDNQVVNNKTFNDAATYIQNNADNTKKAQFDLSGITSGTTRLLTIPDNNITIVGTNATQTLTNKTLTSPSISHITNTGSLTLPTITDTLVARTTTDTLINKTITDTSNVVRATQLATTGSDIVLTSAAPPTAGQTIVAINATSAKWQTISGLTWRNIWNGSTTYAINDMVTYNGSCSICILSNINNAPPNATYWNQVVDGFHWKGTWSSATAYIIDDVVYLSGTSYICILANTNTTPPNATYWSIMTTMVVAGNTTQVQYNNSGALAGSSQVTIDSDSNIIIGNDQGSSPTAPSSGAKLFTRYRSGHGVIAQIEPSGYMFEYQPALYTNKLALWTAQGNGTTVTIINLGNTITGTATTRNVATTNLFVSMRRLGYVSAATAGSSAGTRHGAQQFWIGNASGLGGFFYVVRFGLSSASTVSTQRSFVGLIASTAVLGNADPSSNTNILGFGVNSADTTWYFMHNASGTTTKDTLTGTFPPRDLSVSMFEARIYCPPNSSTIYYSLEVLGGGSFYEGNTSTNIPANTTLLSPQIWTNNGTTATAVGIDIVSQYIETLY
jgi:hypothetical protein